MKLRIEQIVKRTITVYKLLRQHEKVVVAVSGGKDSTAVAYILQKLGYDVSALHINLGIGKWSEKCLQAAKQFCKEQGIKLKIVSMQEEYGCSICYIRSMIQQKQKLSNCFVCGIIKRWLLNKHARAVGADKIATGHNLDDEAETFLMNMFRNNLHAFVNEWPITGILRNVPKFVPRIKPLFFCTNAETEAYCKKLQLPVVYGNCPCLSSFRKEVRQVLQQLCKNKATKLVLVRSFLRVVEKARKKLEKSATMLPKACRYCGEPSRRNICKKCELLLLIEKRKQNL